MEILLVIDLEATCWMQRKGAKLKKPEIIEIGGTTVTEQNGNLKIIDYFSEFVKPLINPHISKFCTELTSITQEDIEDAPLLPVALKRFREKAKETVDGVSCRKMIFGSWSTFDRKQLRADCKLHKIRYPFGRHWNLEKAFSNYMNETRLYSVTKALEELGLEFEGTVHRAKFDALNTARIIQKSIGSDWRDYFRTK